MPLPKGVIVTHRRFRYRRPAEARQWAERLTSDPAAQSALLATDSCKPIGVSAT
jgi:hypothetical protein